MSHMIETTIDEAFNLKEKKKKTLGSDNSSQASHMQNIELYENSGFPLVDLSLRETENE